MAYRSTARFGSSVFIPPPEVFQEGRKGAVQENGQQVPRHVKKRNSEVLNSDPVAMHLLVETAIGDSQAFEILAVEEVEELKQEQKGLDARLQTVRKKFETETKIRDAAQSLTRLASKKDKGHQRGLSSRGSNAVTDSATSDEELNTSNRKTEDLARQLLEIESRMRLIDMRLLMHTAGVLQLTHNGPSKRNHNSKISNGGVQRPDSPASIYTYENGRSNRANGDDSFDERSLYRSPENLDSLMNALQNGTHHHSDSVEQQNQAISSMGKRLEELNERLRELIIQANPERNQEYSLPPQVSGDSLDASIVDRQLDFLDQGLRDMVAEQTNMGSNSASAEVEGRLEGINNQLYAMLSRTDPSGETILPPPETSGNGSEEQLSYMEESFYSIGQLQYSLYEQIDDLRARGSNSEEAEKYETAMTGLWSMMQAGEEDARERKRERRRMLADDPDADEELSPDEDYVANEQFSLMAFSSKVQWLFRRATSLKDKQSILLRQIKQQRELNSKSDAQKEAEFARLNEQIMATRSEKKNIEDELDRAMHQLRQFDGRAEDTQALQDVQQHNSGLEAQLKDAQERSISYEHQLREHQERTHILESQLRDAQDDARVDAATIQAELAQSAAKIDEVMMALRTATTEKETAEARLAETSNALNTKEEELRNLEGEVVRLTTELTFAKAELDGAYGTRAERAAESVANPTIKRELDELIAKNSSLLIEIEALKKGQDAASHSEAEARDSERNLKAELSGMAAEYEALTRDAIQNERDRDLLEANIDKLRDEKEALEMELSDERVKWLGVRSPGPGVTPGAQADMGATSIRMLREDFRKMMRDRTGEGLKALRAEQEERRKLEAVIRGLRKDTLPQKSNLSKSMMA